jgi:hypothetical protein
MRFILALLFIVQSTFAVELSQATNTQILNELSKRLGHPNPSDMAILNAYCLSDELHLELETNTQTIKKFVELRFASDCKKALMKLNLGQFSGMKIAAFCVQSDLYKIKATGLGRLNITTIDHRTSSDCETSATQINRQ